MTELEFYKFVHEHELEYRWDWNREIRGEDVVLWVPIYLIGDFVKLLKPDDVYDGGLDVSLKNDCIAFFVFDICDTFGINPVNVFPKND